MQMSCDGSVTHTCGFQFCSVAQSCPTLCDPMNRSTPGLPVQRQLPESTQTHVHSVGDAIQPSHPLSSPSPPASIFPSIRVFSNESDLRIMWPKDWSFSFNISPSDEHPGLISFRMDWLDLLAVQGTLKSLLQHVWLEQSKYKQSIKEDFRELWAGQGMSQIMEGHLKGMISLLKWGVSGESILFCLLLTKVGNLRQIN